MLTIIAISLGVSAVVGIIGYEITAAVIDVRARHLALASVEIGGAAPASSDGVADVFCGAGSTGPRTSFVAPALASMPIEDIIEGQRAFVASWTSPSDGQL